VSWTSKYGFIAVMVIVFIASASAYSLKFLRYRGISSWPSVPAKVIFSRSYRFTMPTETRYGSSTTTHTSFSTLYRYSVAGIDYEGTMATPDGDSPPIQVYENPRAYYNPNNPGIAVMYPMPYEGTALLLTALLTGMLAGISAFFTLRSYP